VLNTVWGGIVRYYSLFSGLEMRRTAGIVGW